MLMFLRLFDIITHKISEATAGACTHCCNLEGNRLQAMKNYKQKEQHLLTISCIKLNYFFSLLCRDVSDKVKYCPETQRVPGEKATPYPVLSREQNKNQFTPMPSTKVDGDVKMEGPVYQGQCKHSSELWNLIVVMMNSVLINK